MNEEIIRKLEKMLSAQEGILPICSVKECGKILLGIGEQRQELAKSDIPEIYERLISHYSDLGKKSAINGLSHGLCREDFKKYMAELEIGIIN